MNKISSGPAFRPPRSMPLPIPLRRAVPAPPSVGAAEPPHLVPGKPDPRGPLPPAFLRLR